MPAFSFSLTDSPHKSGPTVNATRSKMRASDVENAVAKDIKDTLYTVDTEAFITALFPHLENKQVANAWNHLQKEKVYFDGRWSEFPATQSNVEKTLYKPFAMACNAIVRAWPESTIKISYFDRHSKTPSSTDVYMVASRPDGAGATPNREMEELDRKIEVLEKKEEELKRKRGTHEREKEQEIRKKELQVAERQMGKLRQLYKLWWLRIHIVYEIKAGKSPEDHDQALKQLLAYMRALFIEQLDRRFALGMVLCHDELTLVLCDRSGVVATNKPININSEPERFLRIIAGLSSMSPEQLGWDTAMKIYLPLTNQWLPSYEVSPDYQGVYGNSRYHVHWVIDVDIDEGGKKEVVQYLSVSILSAIRSAEICSRATIVFEVVKFADRTNPQETFALKRYWRSAEGDQETYPSEGDIYQELDDALPNSDSERRYLVASHDIKVNGELDKTLSFIRKGLVVLPQTKPPTYGSIRKEGDPDNENLLHAVSASPSITPEVHLIERCHVNVLGKMGHVIKAFSSLRELLTCLIDYIEDHKHAFDRLYLQRDISGGNLLIFEGANGATFGRLVDYDHAKKAPCSAHLPSFSNNDAQYQLSTQAIVHIAIMTYAKHGNWKVEDDVALEAAKFFENPLHAGIYLSNLIKKDDSLAEIAATRPLSMQDLNWNKTNLDYENWPDFAARVHRRGERTGTLPYMSAEVISGQSIIIPVGHDEAPPFIHNAVHDMESLLWVLIHICMTRQGPGMDMKRDELNPDQIAHYPGLSFALTSHFDGTQTELREAKQMLLLKGSLKFEETIINYFHPYFDPLKPLVRKWWDTLILGYKYRAKEFYYIHDYLVQILRDIGPIPEPSKAAMERELARRKQRKIKILNTFKPRASGTGVDRPTTPDDINSDASEDSSPLAKRLKVQK